MSEEPDNRLDILRQIEAGQLPAEEGVRRLAALADVATAHAPPAAGRLVRVRVTDIASEHIKVNLTLPAALVPVGLRLGAHFAPSAGKISADALLAAVRCGTLGPIWSGEDPTQNERVEIFLE